jgi:hypothetical protein
MPDDPTELFAIVPVPDGKPPADAIAIGSMSALLDECLVDSKAHVEAKATIARAEQVAQELGQQQQREQEIIADGMRKFVDGITDLTRRVDELEQSRETRRALDAATEVTRELLTIPPDAPDPDPEAPADETPAPTGELTTIAPSHPEDKEQLAASEDQGTLPEALLEKTPPDPGTAPTIGFEDARRRHARPYKTAPRSYPQIAVSLNEV